MTIYLFNFQYLQEQVKKTSKKNNISQLKKLLKVAYKHKYIYTNPQCFDARKKIDAAKLKLLGQEFLNSPLVVKAEIKERGWSDRMIEEYLVPDIYKPNKYYKCAGDMKLYSLVKIQRLESEDYINQLIEKNLSIRYQIRVNKERKILLNGIKFVTAIGDYDIAIALLFRALKNKVVLPDLAFKFLEPFIVDCFLTCDVFSDLYIYWVNVKGYRFFYLYSKLVSSCKGSLKNYFLEFDEDMGVESNLKLILSLSGWKNFQEILIGLESLLKFPLELNAGNWEIINKFVPVKYPDPPNADDIFVINLAQEKSAMWEDFLKEISPIKEYQKTGCPKQFDCKLMGGNGAFCRNYFVCKKI